MRQITAQPTRPDIPLEDSELDNVAGGMLDANGGGAIGPFREPTYHPARVDVSS